MRGCKATACCRQGAKFGWLSLYFLQLLEAWPGSDVSAVMLELLPALLLAVLAGPGRVSAQAWSMPGLNDLPALPGVAKDIMHSITSGAILPLKRRPGVSTGGGVVVDDGSAAMATCRQLARTQRACLHTGVHIPV